MTDAEDDLPGDPVCFANKIIAGYAVDERTFSDVNRFRKAERARLYNKRKLMDSATRKVSTQALIKNLRSLLSDQEFDRIAVYWPIRGEPDLRPLMLDLCLENKKIFLPVVIDKAHPLVFRHWHPGSRLVRGLWNIPIPAEGKSGSPDVIISPVVGIDAKCYRLGNGGGYYDKTLAAMPSVPLVIGVGFRFCEIPNIFPMKWDIPMDYFVSELGIRSRRG